MTNKERKKVALYISNAMKYVDYEMAVEIVKAGEREPSKGWKWYFDEVYEIYAKIVDVLHEDKALVERLETNNAPVKYKVLKDILGTDLYLLAERTGIPMYHFADAGRAMAMDSWDHYIRKEDLITDIS